MRFIKKFLALSLSFFVSINSVTNFAFADNKVKANVSPESEDLINVKVIPIPDGYIVDKDENIYASNIIKIEAKSPKNLPLHSKIVTRVENLAKPWSILDFLRSTLCNFKKLPLRIISGLALGGIFLNAKYRIDKTIKSDEAMKIMFGTACAMPFLWEFGDKINFCWKNRKTNNFKANYNGTPIGTVLIPIDANLANILQRPSVSAGAKKQSLKDYENQINAINKSNGFDTVDSFKNTLWEKAFKGFSDRNVDKYDPYNTIQSGTILKYDPNKSSRDPKDYLSDKEANEINNKIMQDKYKSLVSIISDISNREIVDCSNFDEFSWTLTKEKPSLYFLVAVINCDYKTDAIKLSLMRKISYPGNISLKEPLSFNFGANHDFAIPDNEKYNEVLAMLKDPWYKWFFKGILPPWIYKPISSFCSTVVSVADFILPFTPKRNSMDNYVNEEEPVNFVQQNFANGTALPQNPYSNSNNKAIDSNRNVNNPQQNYNSNNPQTNNSQSQTNNGNDSNKQQIDNESQTNNSNNPQTNNSQSQANNGNDSNKQQIDNESQTNNSNNPQTNNSQSQANNDNGNNQQLS